MASTACVVTGRLGACLHGRVNAACERPEWVQKRFASTPVGGFRAGPDLRRVPMTQGVVGIQVA